jgi:hypothetical protein
MKAVSSVPNITFQIIRFKMKIRDYRDRLPGPDQGPEPWPARPVPD